MTKADAQGFFSGNHSGSGTTEHDGSWQHTRINFAAEEQPKLEEKAVENQAEEKSRITSMKRRSYKINKQGSDDEEVHST